MTEILPEPSDDARDDLTKITEPRKRRLFEEIAERDGTLCQHCRSTSDLTLDHVDPDGPTIVSNLQILCRPCNSAKGDRADKTVRWDSTVWQQGFTMIPNKVLLEAPFSANALRVYLLFQHFAHRPDSEWPGQDGLARLARCSERTLRQAIAELEDLGLVRSRRRGLGLTNVYVLLAPRAGTFRSGTEESADPEPEEFADPTRGRVMAKREEERQEVSKPPVAPRSPDRPVTVARRPVTDDEYHTAREILDVFNRTAETAYQSADWIAKIVGRIREHPSLTVEAHEIVIRRAVADPWWKGPVSPSVVYGNASVFERAVHAVRVEPADRGMTAAEAEAYAARLEADLPPDTVSHG